MICKQCGTVFSGQQCPKCGEKVVLAARSLKLDRLMNSKEIPAPKSKLDDYQRGLQEGLHKGYRNGLEDGEQKALEGKFVVEKEFIQHYVPLCAAVLVAVILCISLFGYGAGVRKGTKKQAEQLSLLETENTELSIQIEEELADQYERGFEKGVEKGRAEGYTKAENDLRESVEKEKEQLIPSTIVLTPDTIPVEVILFSKGSQGDGVTAVQEKLYDAGIIDFNQIDADYGDKTVNAVKKFQKAMGLNETGNVDWKTFMVLFQEDSKTEENFELAESHSDDFAKDRGDQSAELQQDTGENPSENSNSNTDDPESEADTGISSATEDLGEMQA